MEINSTENSSTVAMTDAALKEVKRLLDLQGITEGGLRLGVKGGGCSGLSYTVNFDDKIGEFDTVTEVDGVKVIVDAESLDLVDGTEIDFQKDGLNESFRFNNPKVKDTCGCGESFSV